MPLLWATPMRNKASPSSALDKPFMGLPLSVALMLGNIGCWGLYLQSSPPNTPRLSKLVVFAFLAADSLLTWSYRESYYEDRVAVRYLPFVTREVRWKDVQSFSLSPILRLHTIETTLSLPGTPPFLQSFLDAHLRKIEHRGFVISSPTTLFRRQMRHSSVWGVFFVLSVAATAPFLAGGLLHKWWDTVGTILLLCDLQLLVAAAAAFGQTAFSYSRSSAKSHP
jgi:hypothetical protein